MTGETRTSEKPGGCLCGAVRYRVLGALRPVVACHCRQCQRTSGHHVAATAARLTDLAVEGEANLTWYQSSAEARRGFCRFCGGNLFWHRLGSDQVSIMAGSLDPESGAKLAMHIFVDDKADYFEIGDGLPQLPQDGHNLWPEE